MKSKNTPVGTSECPIKGCKEIVPVFKYRDASGNSKKRRFAGRLYCVCPVHQRVENQEFLLEKIQWADPKSTGGPPPETPVPQPKEIPKKQAPSPVTEKSTPPPPETVPVKKSSGWLPEFFK